MTPNDMLKAANEAWQAHWANAISDDPNRASSLSYTYNQGHSLMLAWLCICAEGDADMVSRMEQYLIDNGADGTVQAALAFVKAEFEAVRGS